MYYTCTCIYIYACTCMCSYDTHVHVHVYIHDIYTYMYIILPWSLKSSTSTISCISPEGDLVRTEVMVRSRTVNASLWNMMMTEAEGRSER